MGKNSSTRRLMAGVLAGALLVALHGRARRAGTLRDVAFTDTTPLASSAELARRMLSPLTAAELPGLRLALEKGLGGP